MNDARIGFSPEGNFKRKLTDKTYNGLRCYEIIDGEITSLSVVSSPSNGVMAKIISDENRLISGPILIPDKMIYIRLSKTKKTINEIAIELDIDVEKLIKKIENMGGTISKK